MNQPQSLIESAPDGGQRSPATIASVPMTVCIITYRRPELLSKLLGHLGECELPDTFKEVVVVDNGGDELSDSIVTNAPSRLRARLLRCASPSKCAALNVALRYIADGLIVFLDDDVTPSLGILSAYRTAAGDLEQGQFFGGPSDPVYVRTPPEWLKRFLPPSARGFRANESSSISAPPVFMGFNWAAFASDLRNADGFSEEFGPGTERVMGDEAFMQQRLRDLGCNAKYVPTASVGHFVPPERCSVPWLVKRGYAAGFNAGIRYEYSQRKTGARPRIWAAAIRRLRNSSKLQDLFNLVLLRESGLVWARYWRQWLAGFSRGVRFSSKHSPLSTERWRSLGLDRQT